MRDEGGKGFTGVVLNSYLTSEQDGIKSARFQARLGLFSPHCLSACGRKLNR